MSKQTRREFIKTGASVAGAGLALPVLNRTAAGTTIVKELAANQIGDGNVLVIVELAGGNDGLNTVVPLRQYGTYASLRTRIAHAREALKTSHDSKEILQMVAETGETFATIVAPLQAAGRWPKTRSR